ncbi:MAG: hypothetical protein JKX70_08350 [Phycisphaerales bacterium]|nr:hypothetical protein [Phycisphaerales bacterium]
MKLAPASYGISLLIVVLALGAWLTTGSEGYTRWPDTKLALTDAPVSEAEDDLLADIGFETDDQAEEAPDIESRFVFGLVPGGIDPKHLISVATAIAFALGVSATATIISFRRKSKSKVSRTS